ncbi:MAG: hypothetical protein V4726_11215 [Verrucomicrobiota bacterium]
MPWNVKRELHGMLRDSVPGTEILRWLNTQPEAVAVIDKLWNGAAVTPQNLSDYRSSAEYTKWIDSHTRLAASQEKSKFVLGLAAEAGLDLMDAADALVVSKLLEDLEDAEGEDAINLMRTLASFRKGGNARALLDVRREELKLNIKRTELDREKMEKQTVAAFMKFARTPEAQSILDSGKPKAVQMDLLHALMFGKKPSTPASQP